MFRIPIISCTTSKRSETTYLYHLEETIFQLGLIYEVVPSTQFITTDLPEFKAANHKVAAVNLLG